MLNLSWSTLLNLSAVKQEELVSSSFRELIPLTFTAQIYPGDVESVRKRLTPGVTADERAFNVFQTVRLLRSTELEAYLAGVRDVLTFDPKSDKHFSSGFNYPVIEIDAALNSVTDSDPFTRTIKARVAPEVFSGLTAIRRAAQTPILRVGAMAMLFTYYAAEKLGELT
jgi:hypothetical protein